MLSSVVALRVPRQPGASSPTIRVSKSVRASAAAHSESEQPSNVAVSVFPPNCEKRAVSNGWPLAYRARAAEAPAGRAAARTTIAVSDSISPARRDGIRRIPKLLSYVPRERSDPIGLPIRVSSPTETYTARHGRPTPRRIFGAVGRTGRAPRRLREGPDPRPGRAARSRQGGRPPPLFPHPRVPGRAGGRDGGPGDDHARLEQ